MALRIDQLGRHAPGIIVIADGLNIVGFIRRLVASGDCSNGSVQFY